MVFKVFLILFNPSSTRKIENSIFGMPIITQTFNINNFRIKSANFINLHTIRKLVEYSIKNVWQRQCLLLLFSRYFCPKLGQYCHLPCGAQGAKGLSSMDINN